MKSNFKNSRITDKWIYAQMIMENQNPTFEPFITECGLTTGTKNGKIVAVGRRLCNEYIFFSRIDSKSELNLNSKSSINCSSILQMPPMDI